MLYKQFVSPPDYIIWAKSFIYFPDDTTKEQHTWTFCSDHILASTMSTTIHTLSKKSARQRRNVFIWCGLSGRLSMGE